MKRLGQFTLIPLPFKGMPAIASVPNKEVVRAHAPQLGFFYEQRCHVDRIIPDIGIFLKYFLTAKQ